MPPLRGSEGCASSAPRDQEERAVRVVSTVPVATAPPELGGCAAPAVPDVPDVPVPVAPRKRRERADHAVHAVATPPEFSPPPPPPRNVVIPVVMRSMIIINRITAIGRSQRLVASRSYIPILNSFGLFRGLFKKTSVRR